MNKKLLAVAVAGALAAPGIALAQSSVTISGVFKISLDNIRIGSPAAGRPAGSNTSETRVVDVSSRLIFNIPEDLGGGLAAIAQLDVRVPLDTGALTGTGNDFVGLRSKSLGTLTLGRNDLHYFGRESNLTVRGSLKGDSISLLAFMQDGTAIAGATRTPNTVRYTTPNFGGFSAIVAYSTSPTGAAESDIGNAVVAVPLATATTQRKGNAWNIAPVYEAQNWTVGWSHWDSKPDFAAGGGALATGVAIGGANVGSNADQKADRLFGSYRWGGFHVGFAWDKSRLRANAGGLPIANITGALTVTPGTTLGNRTAWSIPIEYKWGNHSFMGHYTKARNDTATTDQDGAKMFAIAYAYDLSKRTSVALTYAKITNDVGAQYNFFTTQGGLGSASANVLAGEDPRFIAATMRHAF